MSWNRSTKTRKGLEKSWKVQLFVVVANITVPFQHGKEVEYGQSYHRQ